MSPENANDLPKIGYLYHYPSLDHPTDKFRLDVYVTAIPTEKHFDVLHVFLNAESRFGGLERLKVTHPWEFQSSYRVCAGKVILEDRKDKKEEAFCFGGQLTIKEKELLTECILVSPAPIIEINETRPMQVLFMVEVEMLLAEYRTEFPNLIDYEMHLCAVDPYDLYAACLRNLIDKYKGKVHKDDVDLRFLSYLHKEEHRSLLAGLLKDPVPSLDEIFST